MKNVGLFVAVTGALACASVGVQASLSSHATLSFDGNSYFSMTVDPGPPPVIQNIPESSLNGIVLGTTQPATGSHSGAPDGSETPDIDNPWGFFGNTGMSQSTSNITIVSDDGAGNVVLEFSGWSVTWNGIADIPMGSGAWGSNPEGQAVMSCAATCAAGETYTLDYTATVPANDPSNFGGVPYALHLEGTIAVHGNLPANAVLKFDEANSNFGMVVDAGPPPVFQYIPEGSLNGIVLGTTQPATGSHDGAPDGSETPDIDNPWFFFNATGMSQTTVTPVTVIDQDDATSVKLDFAGWGVTWNGIANVPLGSGAWAANPEGQAVMSCADACQENDTYTLDYSATVPQGDPSNFGGVPYSLHLEGTIGVAGPPPTPPVTKPDSVKTKPNESVLIDVLKNDSSPDGLDCTSVAVVTNPVSGTATVDTDAGSADCGSITYLPNVDFKGTDTFEYTVASDLGATSDPTLVTVKVKKGGGGSSSSGCTMSTNNSPYQGEWWLLAGFVAWLGWKQHNQRNRKMH